MLFYRQNNKVTIFFQAIDSLNVPISSAFSYFLSLFSRFQRFRQFSKSHRFKAGLLTTFLTLNSPETRINIIKKKKKKKKKKTFQTSA